MQRRTYLRAVGTAGVVATAGIAGVAGCVDDDATGDHDVGMATDAFLPPEYAVDVGETVVWRNTDEQAHTVTAYEDRVPGGAGYFASGGYSSQEAAEQGWRRGGGAISPGETYEHTFEVPGKYDYFCVPHEAAGMVGTIVVGDGGTATDG